MENEIIVALIGALTTILSCIITFLITRKKYNLELDSRKIQNMDDSFDYYKKVNDETIQRLNIKIEELRKENDRQRQQINNLSAQMINLIGNICFDATCKLRKTNLLSTSSQ